MQAVNQKQMRPFVSKMRQRGDFLISLTVALLITAVIAGSAFIYFRDNLRQNDIKEAVQKVNTTGGSLRANFGLNNQYGSVTTAIAVQSRAIPEDQRIPGTTTAQNVFGGAVTVTPVTLTQPNDGLTLSWANVPTWACSQIVLGTQNTARRISVGGTPVKALDGALTAATMTTQCDVAAPVVITWDFGRTGT